nr:aminotransferase class IV [uncultured Actinoplanes sp.]
MAGRLLVSPSELFGDGVFETVHVRSGRPWLLDEHLDRLARSASLLDLELPPRAEILARVAAAEMPAAAEGALRILCTREALYVTVSEIPSAALRERRSGVRVISADVGHELGRRPAWTLAGAKSLSYGPHFAARRWARHRGADDLLWVSLDGYAVESPTASLVWLADGQLCTVPPDEADILPGTTAARLLTLAPALGLTAASRLIRLADLHQAEAIWLASSLRGLAEVVALDGVQRARSAWTSRLLTALGY